MDSKIVIIGGGAAGIAALSKLLETGFKNVILLEAEDRIGGRIHTVPFASNVVDLGAQWCHGEKGNIVYEMVRKHKVLDKGPLSFFHCSYITSEGEVKPECNDLAKIAFGSLKITEKDLKNYKGPTGPIFIQRYYEALKSSKFKDIDPETAQQFLDCFHKYQNSFSASDSWYESSAAGYVNYKDCDGHYMLNWKDQGSKTVIDFLTKKLPNPQKDLKVEDHIKLNKTVQNIDWSEANDGYVKIYCSDLSIYEADHVILTVSLGVLKANHKNLFTPNLPALKQTAIEGLEIGTINKIFLEYEEPFWPSDWDGFALMWTKRDLEEVRSSDYSWTEHIYRIWRVSYQPNILCAWISGPLARQIESLTDEQILEGLMYLFNKFLFKIMKPTVPKLMLRSKWYSNPNFRGSYSYQSLKTVSLNVVPSDLAKVLYNNLGKPSLLFAGEATHDHYYSTVHGAIESGFREAKRLHDFYRRKSRL